MAETSIATTGWAHPWGQVGVLSFTEVTSWGILYYAFPVFLAPMGRELHWSQASLTGAYSLALLVSGIAGLLVGRWLDHARNPRALMAVGALLGVAGLVLWARVSTLGGFYGLWILLGLAMAATLYEPAFATVAAWFPQRERALTVLTTCGGLASVIYLPVAALLVQHVGWRPALLVLAGVILVGVGLPNALLLRPFPSLQADTLLVSTTVAAWRTWRFWQLVLAFMLAQMALVAVMVHLVPFLGGRGIPAPLAATATGLIGGVSLVGRMVATWRSTARTRATMTALIFLVQAVGIILLLLVPGTMGIIVFIVLFGAGFGVISPARAGLVADRFGTLIYGRVNGQLALAVTLARAAAPAGASLLLGWWGTYPPVFGMLALLSVLGAIVLFLPVTMDPIA
ncbi:MAG: MFS transporter [Ktedonobacterales bacterium]|nr:MFS transporter [Ktedonobacterales bacterium]